MIKKLVMKKLKSKRARSNVLGRRRRRARSAEELSYNIAARNLRERERAEAKRRRLEIHVDQKSDLLAALGNAWAMVGSVILYARQVAKAREQVSARTGSASDRVWDEIEAHENELLRAVERLAGLKLGTLGNRCST
jgi:hypothetical protein